jgi:membrane associated rhomboid family serine protease
MSRSVALLICLAEFAITAFVLGGLLLPAFGLGPELSGAIGAAVGGAIAAVLWTRLRAAPR